MLILAKHFLTYVDCIYEDSSSRFTYSCPVLCCTRVKTDLPKESKKSRWILPFFPYELT